MLMYSTLLNLFKQCMKVSVGTSACLWKLSLFTWLRTSASKALLIILYLSKYCFGKKGRTYLIMNVWNSSLLGASHTGDCFGNIYLFYFDRVYLDMSMPFLLSYIICLSFNYIFGSTIYSGYICLLFIPGWISNLLILVIWSRNKFKV